MFRWLYTLRFVLRSVIRRRHVDAELDEELQYHLEQEIHSGLEAGLPLKEARYAAIRAMGAIDKSKDECRDARGARAIEQLLQDVRFALRQLHRNPGFTAVAVLTLALGIGASTAIFSVVNAALLRPLPFANASSLVIVWESFHTRGISGFPVSPPDFLDWQRQNNCFSGMAAFSEWSTVLTGGIEPDQVDVEEVSPNFFSVLGVAPILGRGFSKGEDQPGKSNVAVLSYGLWKSQFGGDPKVVGNNIQLNGRPVTVIGVAGPDFEFYIRAHSAQGEPPQLWAPLEIPPEWQQRSDKRPHYLRVIARLSPGISLPQAQTQMNVVTARLAALYPEYGKDWGVELVSLRQQLSGTIRTPLFILMAAVGLFLLIACANLASLLLSRACGRRQEIALRLALGASRWRVTTQLLMESLTIGLFGGIAGAVVAVWVTKALIQVGSTSLNDLRGVTVDWRVLVFAAGIAILAGLFAGLLPSLMAAGSEAAPALAEGRRTSASRQNLAGRNAFVVMEIGLALVLLAGSSLLIRSFYRLTQVDPGFDVAHRLTFQLTLPDSKYGQETARASFFSQFLDEIRALPGVLSATADLAPPFDGLGFTTLASIVGNEPQHPAKAVRALIRAVEPGYFPTMDIPLLHGRTFNERELSQQSNVVVINRVFADQYFPGKNPLGQNIVVNMAGATGKPDLPSEIIGVVGDVHQSSLAAAPEPLAYLPYPDVPAKDMIIVVRTATPPLSQASAVREALRRMDKDLPMGKIRTMDQLVGDSVASSRFMMFLLTAFAALALVLACIGIYGVMAYSVAQRTPEIGIRIALGAKRNDVFRMVIQQGFRLTLIGTAVGIAGAISLTRFLSSVLYAVKPTDPLTFVAVPLLLIAIALLACYIPARRAMRVDPMVALKHE